jgi:hypothetical protein
MGKLENPLFSSYLHGTACTHGAVSGMLYSLRLLMLLMRESGASLLLYPPSTEVPCLGPPIEAPKWGLFWLAGFQA